MDLLREYLRKEMRTLMENRIRFSVIGRLADLNPLIQDELRRAVSDTAGNGGMRFNIALSYGGRAEIVDACRALGKVRLQPLLEWRRRRLGRTRGRLLREQKHRR